MQNSVERNRVLWISWETHRRTSGICGALDIPLSVHTFQGSRAARYVVLAWRTLSEIARKRPSTLIVQNPSLVLTMLTQLLRLPFGYAQIVDAHNEAIEPYINNNRFFRFIANFLIRGADRTIVTNPQLAEIVRRAGGQPLVLPDGIPDVPHAERRKLGDRTAIVVISTFEADEPLDAIIEAAKIHSDRIALFVTGDHTKLDSTTRSLLPPNVTLTGYLSDSEYWKLLNSADAIMDLTLMSNCLVCGAYEGVAAKKPLILSDDTATRNHFNTGAIYTATNSKAIASSISDLIENQAQLNLEAAARDSRMREEWTSRADELARAITSLSFD